MSNDTNNFVRSSANLTSRYIGQEVKRIEDPALVSGNVEFIDDVILPGMLHAAILRSPHAHARVVSIDCSAALQLPGVVAVLTGQDVQSWANPMATSPEGWASYCLAVDKVRFVGEPVVAVAATDRYIAEDACELIEVEYEMLPVVADARQALSKESPILFENQKSNVILQRVFNWGDTDRVFAEAEHVISDTFRWNRVGANPTETFGCICQWDVVNQSLTCRGAYQTPSFMALGRAAVLKLPSNKIRIISQPHGGSFGGKGGPRGTDIAALLSRKSGGKPVKYIEDRAEYLLAGGGQSWDRSYEAAIAVRSDGSVTGFKVKLLDDQGAGAEGYGTISVAKPLAAFTGPYRIEAAQYDITVVATNRAPTYPYRGYGPPPHNLVLETLIDKAARKLNIDSADFRRRNFIQPEEFPYTIPSGNEYDSGDYTLVLDRVMKLADYQALREQQAKARQQGRYLGIGVVSTVEPGVFDWNAYRTAGIQGIGVPEGVKISVDIVGQVTVTLGFALEGQGQYTLAAQLVAECLGLKMEDVRVVHASSDVAPPHFGPGGSRLAVAITGAILGACEKLTDKFKKLSAHMLECAPEDIEFVGGMASVKGVPESQMSIAQLAGTMLSRSDLLPQGMDPCPEASHVWTAPGRTEPDEQGRCKSYLTAANASHIVLLEVDVETGVTHILKYFIVDDCGTRLNPATVEGQIQGGVAQGVGAALLEEYVYTEDAQPLVSTFADYLIPTVHEVPMTIKDKVVTPSPFTPLGAKGCGEGAIHTTPAAIICAINDALAPLNIQIRETPASPNRIWKLLQGAVV